jgi:hypothetical protein
MMAMPPIPLIFSPTMTMPMGKYYPSNYKNKNQMPTEKTNLSDIKKHQKYRRDIV